MTAPMTAPLDLVAIRKRHVAYESVSTALECRECEQWWPCDAAQLAAALEAAQTDNERLRAAVRLLQENWPKTVPAPMDYVLAADRATIPFEYGAAGRGLNPEPDRATGAEAVPEPGDYPQEGAVGSAVQGAWNAAAQHIFDIDHMSMEDD